jgi:hypothetical protein
MELFIKDILIHKAKLNKYKKIKIIPSVLSDHNQIKVENNSKRKYKKFPNI